MMRVWSAGAVGEELVEFGDPFADGGDVDGLRVGGGQVGGVVVEPVAGGEAAVLVFGPAPSEVWVVGLGSVAGGGRGRGGGRRARRRAG